MNIRINIICNFSTGNIFLKRFTAEFITSPQNSVEARALAIRINTSHEARSKHGGFKIVNK